MFAVSSYNAHLASKSIDLNFKEYVKEVNKLSNSNINLGLLELEDLLVKNECCIPHSYLYTYKIITTKRGAHSIKDVYNILKKYKEGIDYIIRHIAYKKGKCIVEEKEYYLHPRMFRKILMQKNRNDDYINYFIFIENCMHHYSNYRTKLNAHKQSSIEYVDIEHSIKNIESLVIKIYNSVHNYEEDATLICT